MPTLNLGIVAHVDAGKTTLTERLLFETGVSDHIGSVDRGDTQTDTDALERQRGITIRSAVVSFTIDDVLVNLLDTPGHSDFVAEVERSLAVLDAAVLVVSAVEGVQAQTRVLVRTLERLEIPFLVFVNKIDRGGARYDETIDALRGTLTGGLCTLSATTDLGTCDATTVARDDGRFQEELLELLSEFDEAVLARYVEGREPFSPAELLDGIARLSCRGQVHPVLFGSAATGAGVADLVAGIRRLLPNRTGGAEEPLHATVFKIERGRGGTKVAYASLHSGTLSARDQVTYHRRSPTGTVTEHRGRPTEVAVFRRGTETASRPARAGEIAKLTGLLDVEIGDQLGRWDAARGGRYFASPGLETVVLARRPDDRLALFEALRLLAEQDPLINTRLDGRDHELTVSLYGEVQKEVLAARLAVEFGLEADFSPTQTVYVERVAGVGHALREIGAPGNPELATVGLRVEPAPAGTGIAYRRGVQLGGLLRSYHTAIEETVPATLDEGLFGWRVTDCVVTLTHSGYWAPVSSAGDFRRLTATVLREALDRAGTVVCAPFSEFEVELPVGSLSQLLHRLTGVGAALDEPDVRPTRCRVTGVIPTAAVHEFEQRLPGLTQGEGFFASRPGGYQPLVGSMPTRAGQHS